ncbi:hypothetical protein [Alkalimarinus coralli]|uniref:hypothetical protein n=1 Tax=Alkalimarinus coralli TaxID=2935863 RepID=UPI00202B370E|nr:hypothetical protein [Alkalimarinus coralli]
MSLFIDKIHRLPRIWSNQELRKFAGLFKGDVVNVSAWQDADKEGGTYKEYFSQADSYTITNWKSEARGYQGGEEEIYLDLESDLVDSLRGRFDVVFNHTTLEHIFNVNKAFSNLCDMSKDVVIACVPFLQQYHGEYGDYWRFTPLLVKRLFEENGMELAYLSFNNHKGCSVYIFAIGVKNTEKWKGVFDYEFTCLDPEANRAEPYIGSLALSNAAYRLKVGAGRWVKKIVPK